MYSRSRQPHVRRVSRFELMALFPNTRFNRVSAITQSTNNVSTSERTTKIHQQEFKRYRRRLRNKQLRHICSRLLCSILILIALGAIIGAIVIAVLQPKNTTTSTTYTTTTATTATTTSITTSTTTTSTTSTTTTSTSTSSTTSSSTTTTSSTSTTTTTSSSTSSTSSSTTTSSSTSTTSSSTTSTTSSSTTSTTSSSTTTSTSTSSTTTSSTSTTSTTTTTQDPKLGTTTEGAISDNTWVMRTYTYLAPTTTNLTLTFIFQNDNKHDWYFDNASVVDSSSTEKLTNGNFESSSTLTGWSASSSCSSYGVTTSGYHIGARAFYDSCGSQLVTLSQSFSAIGGQVYTITFWFYRYRTGPGGGSGTNQIDIYMYQ